MENLQQNKTPKQAPIDGLQNHQRTTPVISYANAAVGTNLLAKGPIGALLTLLNQQQPEA